MQHISYNDFACGYSIKTGFAVAKWQWRICIYKIYICLFIILLLSGRVIKCRWTSFVWCWCMSSQRERKRYTDIIFGPMYDRTNLFVGCGRQSVICTDTEGTLLFSFFFFVCVFLFLSFSRLIEIYCLLDGTFVECCLFEEFV